MTLQHDSLLNGVRNTDESLKRNFFIFGHNIKHSLSPTLHNAAFDHLGLPYHYSIHESPNVDDSVTELIGRPDFGGASVTFPHKLQIGKFLDVLSSDAERVGAVNTVIVKGSGDRRVLLGDNTDWVGIKRCIDRIEVDNLQSTTGLVLGAGGAARAAYFALQHLGLSEILVVNRTRSNAEAMISHFPGSNSRIFEDLDQAAKKTEGPVSVIVACVPADDLEEDKIPSELFAGAQKGVLVEMAYRPQVTGMMRVALRSPGWSVLRGVDVLEEQAYAQFELWTGKQAPQQVMRNAMEAKMSGNV